MREDMPESTDHDGSMLHRPFTDTAVGHYFSGDEDRQQKLDLLTHQIPYGGILLIWGEPGIGKTALLHYLETRVNESCRVCRLDAESCIDPRQFVVQILDCFAWQSDIKYNSDGSPLRALRDHLGILQRNGYAPVLMIDDAEDLPDSVFGILEQLFDGDGQGQLTLVLSGSAELKKRLASPLLQPLASYIVHEFELSPLSAAEQTAYVQARLTWAGIENMGPFSATTLKFIYAASRGVPRRINELAQVFWDNRKSGGVGGKAKPVQPWLRQLRYVGPIILISLGVALFNEPVREAIFPAPVSQTSLATRHPEISATAAGVRGDSAGQVTASADDRSGDMATSTSSVSDPQAEAPKPETSATNDNAASVQEETTAPADGSATAIAQVDTVQDEASAPATNESDDRRQTLETQTRMIGEIAVERTRAELAEATALADQTGIAATETDQGQWWLSQPADQYAVQLMAMEASKVDRYLNQHELTSTVTTFRVKGGDKDLLAVAVGPFVDKADAEAKALQWQQRLPGIRPWIRSVASIQQAVKVQRSESAVEWLARVKANEQQLLHAPADAYVVQLMAVNRKAVTDFVDKHGLASKVVYFRTRVDGQERYAALIDDFTDREQAMAAGHRIAAELKGIQPWVRSLASVQKVIRDYEDHPR